jgi:hypothetical protein
MLNEALANITLNTMYQHQIWTANIPVNATHMINVYSLTAPLNFYLPYIITLVVTLPYLALGAYSLHQNGVSAMDGGILQTIMTTTGSKSLEQAAAGGCLGGEENVSPELKELRVKFGELIETGEEKDMIGMRRAGFGTSEEVRPLNQNAIYGVKR